MDEIVLRATDEQLAAILARVGVAAIDRQTGGRVDHVVAQPGRGRRTLAGRQPPAGTNFTPFLDGTGAKDRCHAGGQIVNARADRQIRIAGQVSLRQHDVIGRLRFAAQKAVEPIVEGVAELLRAGHRFELARHRIETKIAAREHDRQGVGFVGWADRAAVARTRAVNRVVDVPVEIVDAPLLVAVAEAGVYFCAAHRPGGRRRRLSNTRCRARRRRRRPLSSRPRRWATRFCRRRPNSCRSGRRRRCLRDSGRAPAAPHPAWADTDSRSSRPRTCRRSRRSKPPPDRSHRARRLPVASGTRPAFRTIGAPRPAIWRAPA